MLKPNTTILILFLTMLSLSSCRFINRVSVDENLKEVERFRRFPRNASPHKYTDTGKKMIIDTVKNYVVSKVRYKERVGAYSMTLVREKKISYDEQGKKTKISIYRNRWFGSVEKIKERRVGGKIVREKL